MARCNHADQCTNPVWCDKARECLKAQPAPQASGHHVMWPQSIDALALSAALAKLADAADDVGVRHFDSDTLPPDVAALQQATLAARELLKAQTA